MFVTRMDEGGGSMPFLTIKSQNDPCFTCKFLNVAVDLHFVPPLSRLPNLDRLLAPGPVIMV